MNDVQIQINKLVEAFVSQVTQVARQAAMQTLTSALDGGGGGRKRAAAVLDAGAKAAGAARRAKGAKRPQEEIAMTMSRVRDFITANPGLRIEQINKQLGTSTRDLALPLRKLISDGAVRTEGEKRSTQYFPGDGNTKSAEPRRKRKR